MTLLYYSWARLLNVRHSTLDKTFKLTLLDVTYFMLPTSLALNISYGIRINEMADETLSEKSGLDRNYISMRISIRLRAISGLVRQPSAFFVGKCSYIYLNKGRVMPTYE